MDCSLTLLSGGLDSVVATAMARRYTKVTQAITLDYGQRAAGREIAAARAFCQLWDIQHEVHHVPWLASDSALTDRNKPLPTLQNLDSLADAQETAAAVWVPNRNGVFINVAASIAEQKKIPWVIVGFNREEAVTFPDNSTGFVEAANRALDFSTQGRVQVMSPTLPLNKTEIARWARAHDLPLDKVWPCYEGGEAWCRTCESCKRFLRAMEGK